MKNYRSIFINKMSLGKVAFFLIMIAIFGIMLSGCNTTDDISDKTVVQEQEDIDQEPTNLEYVDHNLDMNPEMLSEDEIKISLVDYGAKGALVDNELTIMDILLYAVQDEYLARGEYLSIIETFGSQRPYSNIIKSEETHLVYLKEVFDSYGLDFPNDESIDHIIIPDNLLEAAKTGVQAEIDNIEMYELFLSYDLPENVIEVFSSLKNGSHSHLAAFQKQVERLE